MASRVGHLDVTHCMTANRTPLEKVVNQSIPSMSSRPRPPRIGRRAVALLAFIGLAVPMTARADEPEERLLGPEALRWDFSVDAPREAIGLETSLLWPAYPGGFFVLRGAFPVWPGHGEILAGAQARIPEDRPEEGRFHNIDAQFGWRQHLAWGFHVDALLTSGWAHVSNSTIDGRDYDSVTLEAQVAAGWRFAVGPLYAAIQPVGLAAVLAKSNPWPIRGQGSPNSEGPIYLGNVLFGVLF
jgi:hypothetical protein